MVALDDRLNLKSRAHAPAALVWLMAQHSVPTARVSDVLVTLNVVACVVPRHPPSAMNAASSMRQAHGETEHGRIAER